MLYERDYKVLTETERTKMDKLDKWFADIKSKYNGFFPAHLSKYLDNMPLAAIFHKSLFPNNKFVTEWHDLKNTERILKEFEELLNRKVNEQELLNYIKKNDAYFLIVTCLRFEFFTGNHGAYIFREFALPPNYVADYLIIGKNSGGYDFIFVELESVCDNITTKTGEFGTTIRKGIKQVEEWDSWIDANFSHLKIIFNQSKNPSENLDEEFYSLDKSRIHYAVIAGRRADYLEKTYRLRRKTKKSQGIAVLHYDNLIDSCKTQLQQGMEIKMRNKTK